MGKKIFCTISSSSYADRLFLFAESSDGHFGHIIGQPYTYSSSDSGYESTSTTQIRVVAVPSQKNYYCSGWSSLSTGATATNYGLLTFTGSSSSYYQNRCSAITTSTSGPRVVIIDDHGTHVGTPTTSSTGDYYRINCVIGVKHLSTNEGYEFKGWTVEFARNNSSSYVHFLSSFSSDSEATTSGNITTISKDYDSAYATVVQLGTSSINGVTFTAIYEEITEPSYIITFYNGSDVYTTSSGTASSGIVLPSGPTPSYGYTFAGWNINGNLYTAGSTYYPSGTTYSITATATYQELTQRTLSYQSAYGTPPAAQQVITGSYVSLASATSAMTSAASAAGFQFDGWILNGETTLRSPGYSFSLTENRTATAQFSHLPVTLQYYTGYPTQPGSLIATISNLTYGAPYQLQDGPSRTGYTFQGWLVTDKGGESSRTYDAGATIILNNTSPDTSNPHVEPITAIALWASLTTFVVHYNKNNTSVTGDDIPDEYVTEGNQVMIKDALLWHLDGYTFSKWYGSDSKYYLPNEYFTPVANTTLNAVWDSNTVGNAQQDYTDYKGNTTFGLQGYTTTHSGYTFYFSSTIKTQNITISFQYYSGYVGSYYVNGTYYQSNWRRYTVVWDSSSGSYRRGRLIDSGYSYATASSSSQFSSTASISADVPSESIISSSNSSSVDSHPLGYSSYSSLSSSGSSSDVTDTYTNYSIKDSPDPVYTAPEVPNYTFKGWYGINQSSTSGVFSVDKNLFTHLISSNRQITLSELTNCNYIRTYYISTDISTVAQYANPIRLVYEGVPVVITFDANGGVCDPCYMFARYGDTYGNLPTPTNEGGTFLGWFTAPSGGTQVTSTTLITNPSDHSIYAHWDGGVNPSEYTVTFVDLTGTNVSASRTFTRGVSTSLPLIVNDLAWSVPAGYTLSQSNTWNNSPSFVGTSYADGASVIDLTTFNSITLYASWVGITYTITLNANGGAVYPTSITVPHGSMYGYLPVPSFDGYNFKGWYTATSGGSLVTASTIATASITIYAQWDSAGAVSWGYIEFDINLVTNGGTLDSSYKKTYFYGSAKNLPTSSQITYSGKTFGGWYENSSFSGSAVTTIPVGSSGTKTYYAKWT